MPPRPTKYPRARVQACRPQFLLALHEGRAALIKEYDGQVKTPEDRRDDRTDNEIDGEAAIKLYDELVKSPEDRLALEKEIPP